MTVASRTGEIDQLDLLNKLQRILGEGAFVATYKYALILALAELSVEKTRAPDGSLTIPILELTERFVILYWRQTAPFGAAKILHQSTGQQASVINLIAQLRAEAPTLASARRHRRWARLITSVGKVLVENPLWRLQLVGLDRLDFLYEERLIDGAVVLRPGIASFFQQQFRVVQALVQMAWLTFVQNLAPNRALLGTAGDLAEFLFGADRSGLRAIVEGLCTVQANRCFYCGRVMSADVAVDHFIPWSRYPRDLGHNFVLAHAVCNQSKRDMLAAPVHLERWVTRTLAEPKALKEVFDGARFMHDVDASMSVVEWSYESAERIGAALWLRGKETCHLSPDWRRILTG